MKKFIFLTLILLFAGIMAGCQIKDDDLTKVTLSEVTHSVV